MKTSINYKGLHKKKEKLVSRKPRVVKKRKKPNPLGGGLFEVMEKNGMDVPAVAVRRVRIAGRKNPLIEKYLIVGRGWYKTEYADDTCLYFWHRISPRPKKDVSIIEQGSPFELEKVWSKLGKSR